MKIQWEYNFVERPFCEQLQNMGWTWIEGDVDVPELTERASFRDVFLRERFGAVVATSRRAAVTYRERLFAAREELVSELEAVPAETLCLSDALREPLAFDGHWFTLRRQDRNSAPVVFRDWYQSVGQEWLARRVKAMGTKSRGISIRNLCRGSWVSLGIVLEVGRDAVQLEAPSTAGKADRLRNCS